MGSATEEPVPPRPRRLGPGPLPLWGTCLTAGPGPLRGASPAPGVVALGSATLPVSKPPVCSSVTGIRAQSEAAHA